MNSSAVVREATLPRFVESRLDEFGPELGGRQVLFLPNRVRGDNVWYGGEEVYSAADAKAVDLDAAYLLDATERRYLREHSATVYLIEFAVAVASTMTASSLQSLIAFCRRRARRQSADVNHSIEPEAVPLKVTLTRVNKQGDTSTRRTLIFEGTTESVVRAMNETLVPAGEWDDSPARIDPQACEDKD